MSTISLRRPIVVDTREPKNWDPWKFPRECPTQRGTLHTGDYSLLGLEHFVIVERKAKTDFVAMCGRERDREERKMARLSLVPVRAVIIEATVDDIVCRRFPGVMNPSALMGSVLAWTVDLGIPFIFAGNEDYAARCCYHLLLMAERRYEEQRRVLALRGDPDFADSANKRMHAPRRRRRVAR